MKIAALAVGALLCVGSVARAEQLTGWLSDAKCAKAGKTMNQEHAECARKCVAAGEPIVLVTDEKKIYNIKNQDKVKGHVGEKVTVEGKLEGDTIEVERGRPAE